MGFGVSSTKVHFFIIDTDGDVLFFADFFFAYGADSNQTKPYQNETNVFLLFFFFFLSTAVLLLYDIFLVWGVFNTSGCIFTIVGARVNVRVRQRLFDSLVKQEIGFFDTTKTGDLTSRLASDCTKVGDQVTVNVNVFLRWVGFVFALLFFVGLVRALLQQ